MAQYYIQGETLTAIADAIRAKYGSTNGFLPTEMAQAIRSIPSGNGSGSGSGSDFEVLPSTSGILVEPLDGAFAYTDDGYLTYTLADTEAFDTMVNGYNFYFGMFTPDGLSMRLCFYIDCSNNTKFYQCINSESGAYGNVFDPDPFYSLRYFLEQDWLIDPSGFLSTYGTGGSLLLLYGN